MECIHAYRRNNVEYIICDCGGKVQTSKLSEIAPKLCLYQRFCPNVRNCTLLPTWHECSKLKEKVVKQEAEIEREENGEVKITKAPEVPKRKSTKKKT